MGNVIYVDFVNKRRLTEPSRSIPEKKLSEKDEMETRLRIQELRNEVAQLYNSGHISSDSNIQNLFDELTLLGQTLGKA